LAPKREFSEENTQSLKPEYEIASYAACPACWSPAAATGSLIDRLARYEAERASFFLETEDPEIAGSSLPGSIAHQ